MRHLSRNTERLKSQESNVDKRLVSDPVSHSTLPSIVHLNQINRQRDPIAMRRLPHPFKYRL